MKFVFCAPNETESEQRKGIKDFLFARNIYMGDCTILLSDYEFGNAKYDNGIKNTTSDLNEGDTLYVWDIAVLGKSLNSLYANLLYLCNKGITIIQCMDGEVISNDNTESIALVRGIGIASRISSSSIQNSTKKGLAEKRRLIEQNGGFYSKSGKWVTKLGSPKVNLSEAARKAASLSKKESTKKWRESSVGFKWAVEQRKAGLPYSQIVEEFNKRHITNPEDYSTRTGGLLTEWNLRRWEKEDQGVSSSYH